MIASKIKAEKFANELRNNYYLDKLSNVELFDLLAAENIDYEEIETKSSLGSLIRHNKFGRILVNSSIKQNSRKRFVIAHELGHWKMHSDIKVFNCDKSKFEHWNDDVEIIEKEANWFASEFLMPKNQMKKFINSLIRLELFTEISNYFGTSLTASSIKYIDMISIPMMLVFTKKKFVRWYMPSKYFDFSFYDNNFLISDKTATAKCYRNNFDKSYQEVIIAKTWFEKDFSVKSDNYLNELVIPLPKYKSTLTFLWNYKINI